MTLRYIKNDKFDFKSNGIIIISASLNGTKKFIKIAYIIKDLT